MKTWLFTLCSIFMLQLSFGQQKNLVVSAYKNETSFRALQSVTLKAGFHIPTGKNVTIGLLDFPNAVSSPTSGMNYILTRSFRTEVKAFQLGAVRRIDQENQTIQYFDGLGRPSQTVQLLASPGFNDVVQHIEYDAFGKESVKYLPYVDTIPNGSYKTGGNSKVTSYYERASGADVTGVLRMTRPYAVTRFENSALNRVLEQGATGQAWQLAADRKSVLANSSSGHTLVITYATNVEDEVNRWVLEAVGATVKEAYAAGKLHKTITKDENWLSTDGKAGTIEEFQDFAGRLVLKRVWETNTKALNTYYVYDDFGDLRYVVPPGFTGSTFTEDKSGDFYELIYAYRYDGRRRLVEKKIPGKVWEYIVYNKNDQVILTQDSIQRAAKKWSYIKYDQFGRVASTEVYTNTTAKQATRKEVQSLADVVSTQWESRVGTASYTNNSFPNTQLAPLTINYYDDYTFNGASGLPIQGLVRSDSVKTLLTGSLVYMDDGKQPLLTVYYYNDLTQIIQSISQNHLNGTDRVSNEYTFTGELTKSTRVHTAKGVSTTIVAKNEYDHVGRLLATKHKIGNQDTVLLVKNDYNEIGQLKKQSIGGDKNETNFHTTVDYSYNERGWTDKAVSPHFTYDLNYHVNSGNTVITGAQYNGNIAQQLWGHGATTNSTFAYSYDKLNRLKNGTSSGVTIMVEALTYDDMGNIRTLARNNGITATTTSTTYAYNNNNKSNRLSSLTGALAGISTYSYDVNGNATKDRTGMTIGYNHLNLPDTVYNAAVKIGYLYDALGTKLRKYSTLGGIREYIGGIEYAGTVMELIHTGQGIAFRNSSGSYTYRYNLTDHLGNVRATVYRNPTSNAVEVLQKDDYYPFGKQRVVAAGVNRYLYNGKEKQEDFAGQYDYGARFYDAEIGRWNVVDPLAELSRRFSPYNYVVNNPLRFIDPDGRYYKEYDDEDAYYAENPNGSLDGSDGHLIEKIIHQFGIRLTKPICKGPMVIMNIIIWIKEPIFIDGFRMKLLVEGLKLDGQARLQLLLIS